MADWKRTVKFQLIGCVLDVIWIYINPDNWSNNTERLSSKIQIAVK